MTYTASTTSPKRLAMDSVPCVRAGSRPCSIPIAAVCGSVTEGHNCQLQASSRMTLNFGQR
jgi:hypothetical protein